MIKNRITSEDVVFRDVIRTRDIRTRRHWGHERPTSGRAHTPSRRRPGRGRRTLRCSSSHRGYPACAGVGAGGTNEFVSRSADVTGAGGDERRPVVRRLAVGGGVTAACGHPCSRTRDSGSPSPAADGPPRPTRRRRPAPRTRIRCTVRAVRVLVRWTSSPPTAAPAILITGRINIRMRTDTAAGTRLHYRRTGTV